LQASDSDGDPLVYSTQVLAVDPVAQRAYELDQRLGLRFSRSYRTNLRRAGEKYMLGNGGRTYFILPNGELHLFRGTIRRSPLVATLSPAYYANPALLHDARPPGLTPSDVATVTVAGSELVIDPRAGFLGSFTVVVTASDGTAAATQSFQVVVANDVPYRQAAVGGSGTSSFQPPAPSLAGIDPQVRQAVDQLMAGLFAAEAQAARSAALPWHSAGWSWRDAAGNDLWGAPLAGPGNRQDRVLQAVYAEFGW
jgi:hypothetical protein